MKFSDIAVIRKSTVHPKEFGRFTTYLGFEHLDPGALAVTRTGNPLHVTSTKQKFRPGDTIYGKLRPYFRKVAWLRDLDGLCSTDFWVFEPKSGIDPRFVFYVAATQAFTDLATSSSEGTRMPRASWSVVKNFEFPDFTFQEQRAIAAALGALDDKIESNRRSVELIEHLLVLEFQNLLGTEAVDYRPLSELTSITKGVSYKSADLQPSATSLVTLKSFDRNGGYKANGLKQYVGPYKLQQVIEPGEVVVAQTDLTQGAEVVGRAVRVPADSSADVLVASLDLVIVRPSAEITPEYLLGVLVDESFREHCRSRTSGTTVLHLASDAIPSYLAPIVPAIAQQRFSVLSHPLIARADSLNMETVTLASLRDALLPELLSGRIRVPEAREAVQEVVA